ncbi:hypothetical protein DFR67_11855 [Williamsia limnetica]|jgi:hypothetical protein|uniref:Uncharacterized protein n=1 Tax=Williamsia limnetica TaxID=882452 RepID=A0A318RG55_WILLI|nr:hypothetical protein [Williamsia limnetica]PYE13116.1 hypothetical protein DFR67_11855 [Williamsia limnetica]
MAISTVRAQEIPADTAVPLAELPDAVARLTRVTPDRVVVRYRSRGLNYRELAAAIQLMMPVTRSQNMDDRSAVVAAIFAGIPSLGSEPDSAVVAAVVDAALARVGADLSELNSATAPPRQPVRANRTSEMDLRVIASRLSSA